MGNVVGEYREREGREINYESIPVKYQDMKIQRYLFLFTFLGIYLLKESTIEYGEFLMKQLSNWLLDSICFPSPTCSTLLPEKASRNTVSAIIFLYF